VLSGRVTELLIVSPHVNRRVQAIDGTAVLSGTWASPIYPHAGLTSHAFNCSSVVSGDSRFTAFCSHDRQDRPALLLDRTLQERFTAATKPAAPHRSHKCRSWVGIWGSLQRPPSRVLRYAYEANSNHLLSSGRAYPCASLQTANAAGLPRGQRGERTDQLVGRLSDDVGVCHVYAQTWASSC
jgi:hypothetical protein